jgi:hypothetical protein
MGTAYANWLYGQGVVANVDKISKAMDNLHAAISQLDKLNRTMFHKANLALHMEKFTKLEELRSIF